MVLNVADVEDFRRLAARRLPRFLFDYVDGGAFDERTMAANREDLQRVLLRQRVLRDVATVDTATHVLGQARTMPLGLAAVGLAGMYARRGEVQVARAAEAAGVEFVLSTVGVCSIEEVAAATRQPFSFQLYVMRDRGYVAELLGRAAAARCPTLYFTVDLARLGRRNRDTRSGAFDGQGLAAKLRYYGELLRSPGWAWDVGVRGKPHGFGNLLAAVPNATRLEDFKAWVASQFDASVTWKDIETVRERWPGRLVLKGILDVEDAREAVRVGADGIVVSNHGGRQLEGAPSSIAALPAIADAVGDRLEVLFDGGVRSGQDVAKALASGARYAMIGRAWAYALAAGGEAGVAKLLGMIREELVTTMALLGVTRVDQLTREVLYRT